ncbi:MAG: hypothetical protein HC881_24135 [Leptolyngbyaceae cyanobacterium SL_7_1]|nr:hypothetical protein [Leptolyngbyaceae cyanobacterium SL_7_1]
MKESQTRIQEIQERLQAIQAGHGATAQPSPSSSQRDRPANPDEDNGFVLTMEPIEPVSRTATATQSSGMVELTPNRGARSQERPPQLVNQVETLSQKSHQVVQRWQQTQFQPPQFPPTPVEHPRSQPTTAPRNPRPVVRLESVERLEGQIDRINQLSSEQEKALLDLRTIADSVEQELRALERSGHVPASVPSVHYGDATVPWVERGDGKVILTSRAVDLYQAEHDATWMAEVLRNRTQPTTPTRKHTRSRGQDKTINGIRRLLRQGILALEKLFGEPTGAKSPRVAQSYAIAALLPSMPKRQLFG